MQKIESLQTYWFQRCLYFNTDLEKSVDWIEAKNELACWNPTIRNIHDDFLDALISAIYLMPLITNSSKRFDPIYTPKILIIDFKLFYFLKCLVL